MKKKHKLLFVIPSLSGGGAERFFVNILRAIDRERFTIFFAIGKKEGPLIKFIPDDIALFELKASRTRTAVSALWLVIKRIKPDIVIATMGLNMACAIVEKFIRVPPKLVIRVASDPTCDYMRNIPFFVRLVQKFSYCKSDLIIALTGGMKKKLCETYKLPYTKVEVIGNPIDIKVVKDQAEQSVGHPWFSEDIPIVIAAGRLDAVKGYATLLKAFSFARRQIHVRLVILGEGRERRSLEALGKELKIQDDFLLPGFKMNPYSYIARSTLFVLSSFWEGFPNVLLEAMACGTPVISTRYDSGPETLIEHEVNGLLVPSGDEKTLATAMIRMLEDPALRNRLREAAYKRINDFEIEKIARVYENEFFKLLEGDRDEPIAGRNARTQS